MDVSEQKPEPTRKRKNSSKKIIVEPVIASGLDTPPASSVEQVQVSHVQGESPVAQPVVDAKPAPFLNTVVKGKEQTAAAPGIRSLHWVLKGGGWLVNLCSTAIISILLGFSPPVTSSPILDFIERYKLTTLIILSIVVFCTLVALVVWPFLHNRLSPIDARLKAMGVVTGISMLSSVLCFSLLMITLFRPSWCPTSLCTVPKVITQPITTTQGSHDANLDVYFVSFESPAYVIPGDPQKPTYIPSSGDPRSIGAVSLNATKASTPYTISIGLHSLYTGRYSIFIDKVTLLLTKVSRVPNPLRVYPVSVLTRYSSTNPSRFVYQGQQAKQTIDDSYSSNPLPRVELRSGESDQIDATIEALTPVDMQFVIQVTYHIATEQQHVTLTLNHTFEAVFSKATKWQEYQLNLAQNNFVPLSGTGG